MEAKENYELPITHFTLEGKNYFFYISNGQTVGANPTPQQKGRSSTITKATKEETNYMLKKLRGLKEFLTAAASHQGKYMLEKK